MTIIARQPDKQRKLSTNPRRSGLTPKKSLGQHFLRNNEGILLIVDALNPENGDFFIEIGPGEGQLTFPLLNLRTKKDLSLNYVGIEKDEKLVEMLQKKLSGIELILGDARKLIPNLSKKAKGKLKIFGNIPYYLTGNLMRTLTEIPKKPELALFTIQSEVAKRIIAGKGDMNRLGAMLGFFYSSKVIATFKKNDFYPPPKVDSSAILLSIRPEVEKNAYLWGLYEQLVRHIFAQPRKTLENNLKKFFCGNRNKASQLIADAGLAPSVRPQELTLQNLIKMSVMVYNNPDGMQEK